MLDPNFGPCGSISDFLSSDLVLLVHQPIDLLGHLFIISDRHHSHTHILASFLPHPNLKNLIPIQKARRAPKFPPSNLSCRRLRQRSLRLSSFPNSTGGLNLQVSGRGTIHCQPASYDHLDARASSTRSSTLIPKRIQVPKACIRQNSELIIGATVSVIKQSVLPHEQQTTKLPSVYHLRCVERQLKIAGVAVLATDNLQIPGSCSMSLVSSQNSLKNSLISSTESDQPKTPDDTEATLSTLLGAFTNAHPHSMDRGATEYSQSGLHSPYPNAFNDAQSEESTADHASAAQYTPQQEVRPNNNYSTSATPTSEYGVYPASARSGSFPEHIQRQYHPASNHSGSSGGMAQSTSPSMPLQDGRPNHHNPQIKSDQDVPIDPSIAASSPTYPAHGGQYSPYPPQQDMQHGYPSHPGGAMYTQPRPDWAGYGGHPQHPMQGGYAVTGAQTPTSAAPAGARPGQVSNSNSIADSSARPASEIQPAFLYPHGVVAVPGYPVSIETR